MGKEEAIRIIKKEIKKLLPCPFCGEIPKIKYRVDKRDSGGFIGHFVERVKCCDVVGSKSDLFYCNNKQSENYELWSKMVYWIVYYWNLRFIKNL